MADNQNEEPRVRVMSDEEKRSYAGVTLDEDSAGGIHEEQDRTQNASAYDAPHIVFSHTSSEDMTRDLMSRLLGRHWKLKLILGGTGLVLALFFFFIALPALSVLLVVGGIVYLLAGLFSF